MSLPHAILGFLSWYPSTGYELRTQCFDISVANFWPADQAQIYRTLDRLEREGWATSAVEIQHDRPNRKVYSITAAGRAELHRWLLTPQPLPVHREPLLVQLFFAGELSNDEIVQLLEGQVTAHERRLADYEAVSLPALDDPAADRQLVLQRLTLELGLRTEHAYLDWLRDAIERMRGLGM